MYCHEFKKQIQNTNQERERELKGFTLIELLIVIAIIGTLAGILFVSIGQGPLKKARDAKRKSDLNQVMKALDLYHFDYGSFCVQNAGSGGNGWLNYQYISPYSVAKQLVNLGYIGAEARDPKESGDAEGYMISCATDHVTLWATLEGASVLDNCYHSDYDNGYSKNYCISQ